MKIGFACSEYFNYWEDGDLLTPTSAHGGFGFLTKIKAEALTKMGHDVHVFTYASNYVFDSHRPPKDINVNGVNLHLIEEKERTGHSRITTGINYLLGSSNPNEEFMRMVKEQDIELIQFEDTPLSMLRANIYNTQKILVFQDPFDYYDQNLIADSEQNYLNIPNSDKLTYAIKPPGHKYKREYVINYLHKKNFVNPIMELLQKDRTIHIFTEADFISKKVQNLFNLRELPHKLLNPVDMTSNASSKSKTPSFVWIGRWDPQKRPDMMLEIAKNLPEFEFYIIGTATVNVKGYVQVEQYLIEKYKKYDNIHILGFVDENKKRELISKAWGLINTSVREGLPITFLESLSEGTPIISYVDPDGYVRKFGSKVDYTVSSYIKAIKDFGNNTVHGQSDTMCVEFIKKNHSTSVVIRKHLEMYEDLLSHI